MTASLTYTAHRDAIAAGRVLRVVNYHNTPRSGRDALRQELTAYAAAFDTVSLAELDAFFATGSWESDRPGFIPVFYEGYRNSYDVAGAVCDELGLHAWFAICTGFVECAPAEQELFARSHFIGLVAEERGTDRLALTWDEIGDLAQRHTVYPHTSSHAGIADVVTDDDVEREITRPKQLMDAHTGQSAASFAWLHGSPFGGSPVHDDALRAAGYRYLVSNTMVQEIRR